MIFNLKKTELDGKKRIVFFDGSCGFCDYSVRKLIRRDSLGLYRFAPLQGETAKQVLPEHLRQPENLSTMVLAEENDGQYQLVANSSAVLNVLSNLGGTSKLISYLRIVPKVLRDFVYAIVVKNRHKLSAKLQCEIPTEEDRARFID